MLCGETELVGPIVCRLLTQECSSLAARKFLRGERRITDIAVTTSKVPNLRTQQILDAQLTKIQDYIKFVYAYAQEMMTLQLHKECMSLVHVHS